MNLQNFVHYPVDPSIEELEEIKNSPIKLDDFCADGTKEILFERIKKYFSFFECKIEIGELGDEKTFHLKKGDSILGILSFEPYQSIEKALIKVTPLPPSFSPHE